MTVHSNSKRLSDMKYIVRFIYGLFVLTAVSACSAAVNQDFTGTIGNIHGIVTDTDGNPLNHIKVILDYGSSQETMTVYTSMKGEFFAEMASSTSVIKITLEDIDGEDNGGLFEPMTDQIMIMDEFLQNGQETINLEYRLTLSTASEYNPQS